MAEDPVDLPPDLENEEDEKIPDGVDSESEPDGECCECGIDLPDDFTEDDFQNQVNVIIPNPEEAEAPPLPPDFTDKKMCTCKRDCLGRMGHAELEKRRTIIQKLPAKEKQEYIFNKVYVQMLDADKNIVSKGTKLRWTVDGQQVCLAFWQHCHATGPNTVQEIRELVHAGHIKMPDAPLKQTMPGKEWLAADFWFHDLYKAAAQEQAETINDADDLVKNVSVSPGENPDEFDLVEMDNHPLWSLGVLVPDPHAPEKTLRYVRKKHINHCSFEDIYQTHCAEMGATAVSRSTLRRCWQERWMKFIKVKNIGQGKRCRKCAILAMRRKNTTDPVEQAKIAEELKLHHDENRADRNTSGRQNLLAERDAEKWNTTDGHDLYGKISLDGMDEAKWTCPQKLPSSADLEVFWKPNLHVVCSIVHGIVECYYIMPPDLPKDSNMESTIIARSLDVALELLPPGTMLPESFGVNADNTAREAKNQFACLTNAWMVSSNKFGAMEQGHPKTGHSHNEVDQRFSSANAKLKGAPTLEDPWAVKEWCQRNLQPVRGRKLHVEVLSSLMDFRKWLTPLDVKITGLAAVQDQLDTCHSWRFIQRRLLGAISGMDESIVDNQHPDWQNVEPHPLDCILLLKESMSSMQLAQRPLLILPHVVAMKVAPGTLEPVPRACLGDTTIKEFRKCAKVVGSEPWHFYRAQNWLLELCDDSEQNKPVEPIVLPVLNYRLKDTAPLPSTFGTTSVVVPRTVALGSIPPAERKKRMGWSTLTKKLARNLMTKGAKAKEDRKNVKENKGQPLGVRKKPAAADPATAAETAAGVAAQEGPPAHEAPGVPEAAGVPKAAGVPEAAAVAAAAPKAGAAVRKKPAMRKRPAAPSVPSEYGCTKCRYSRIGCVQCRAWAATGKRGYKRTVEGHIIRDLGS